MTKTLTEQWREGTLKEGWYYTIIKGIADAEKMIIDYFIPELNHFEIKPTRCIKEVLAPVPSYDEYKRLQEQLKEARHTIYCIANTDGSDCKTILETIIRDANLYLEKWGVK